MSRNLTALILAVLAVGIYFTVTSPMIDGAKSVMADNAKYLSALNNANQILQVRDQVHKQYDSISPADQARLDKMIPSTVDNIRLIIDLSNIALKHGFPLTDVRAAASTGQGGSSGQAASGAAVPPAQARGPIGAAGAANPAFSSGQLGMVDVSFGATATYDQFISFMQDLESDLRVMDLTQLSLSASDTGTYSFQVQFQTYWLPQ